MSDTVDIKMKQPAKKQQNISISIVPLTVGNINRVQVNHVNIRDTTKGKVLQDLTAARIE